MPKTMEDTRIIVVEDIDEIRESVRNRIARTPGLSCIGAYSNAEDALQRIPEKMPDVVVMDIGLPYMNGIECMLRIKIKHPEIKFLMFTVFDHDEKIFEALKAGADGYILKESGAAGAIRAIEELKQGGAPMSSTIAKKVLRSFHHFAPPDESVENLTARQVEILQLLADGLLYKEIAERLYPPISEGGLKQHINRIYKKLEVNNRTEAINKWLGDKK